MDSSKQVKNQVTSARTQIWQQLESAQQYLKAAQQDVHQFVEQQREEAKTRQTSQVVEAARQAAIAKVTEQLQTAGSKSETQARLRELVAILQEREHPSQQQAQQRTVDVTKTADDIFDRVTQLFETLSFEPIDRPENFKPDVPRDKS